MPVTSQSISQCQCYGCRANRGESPAYTPSVLGTVYMCENPQQVTILSTDRINVLYQNLTNYVYSEPPPKQPPKRYLERVNGVNIIKMDLNFKINERQ